MVVQHRVVGSAERVLDGAPIPPGLDRLLVVERPRDHTLRQGIVRRLSDQQAARLHTRQTCGSRQPIHGRVEFEFSDQVEESCSPRRESKTLRSTTELTELTAQVVGHSTSRVHCHRPSAIGYPAFMSESDMPSTASSANSGDPGSFPVLVADLLPSPVCNDLRLLRHKIDADSLVEDSEGRPDPETRRQIFAAMPEGPTLCLFWTGMQKYADQPGLRLVVHGREYIGRVVDSLESFLTGPVWPNYCFSDYLQGLFVSDIDLAFTVMAVSVPLDVGAAPLPLVPEQTIQSLAQEIDYDWRIRADMKRTSRD